MLSVQELPNVAGLTAHRQLWHGLWRRTPRASFRQTPEFLQSHAEHHGHLWRVFVASVGDRVIGLVPLLERTNRRWLGTSRVLAAPDSPWGLAPANGVVGPHPGAALAATIRHLHHHDDAWELLQFPEVISASGVSTRVARAFAASELDCSSHARSELLSLELPENWSQFWANRDAESRQQWRELDMPFWRQGELQFVRFRPAGASVGDTERNWKFLRLLDIILRRQRSAGQGERAAVLLENLRETHAATVDAGCADVCVLLLDSQPAAAAYNVHRDGQVETLLLLSDPHDVSAAADLLIGQMLRDEIARGDRTHWFLPGSTADAAVEWRMWQADSHSEAVVTHDRHAGTTSRLWRRWLTSSSRR